MPNLTHVCQRTYTCTNLYNDELHHIMNSFLSKIEAEKTQHAAEMPADVECMMHLDRNEEDTDYECYYYLVDHANRILFWMNEFQADDMLAEIDGVTDPNHMRK
jgi:hypothetical protein